MIHKIEAFNRCLTILLAADRGQGDEIYRMGVIGQFNLTFELSWKALREVLLIHGVNKASTGSPREILKVGYEFNFLSDEETWLDMLKHRNQVAQIYDEKIAAELVDLIFEKYIAAFENLRDELQRRTSQL